MMIRSFRELDVWKNAMELAMVIYAKSQSFPPEERYSLTDQIRRCSRSVASNIAEAWHKRRYPAAFVSKLSDAEGEAAETQTWTELCRRCGYITDAEAHDWDQRCEHILGQLIRMANHADTWCAPLTKS